jgi:hypothetical protein
MNGLKTTTDSVHSHADWSLNLFGVLTIENILACPFEVEQIQPNTVMDGPQKKTLKSFNPMNAVQGVVGGDNKPSQPAPSQTNSSPYKRLVPVGDILELSSFHGTVEDLELRILLPGTPSDCLLFTYFIFYLFHYILLLFA